MSVRLGIVFERRISISHSRYQFLSRLYELGGEFVKRFGRLQAALCTINNQRAADLNFAILVKTRRIAVNSRIKPSVGSVQRLRKVSVTCQDDVVGQNDVERKRNGPEGLGFST